MRIRCSSDLGLGYGLTLTPTPDVLARLDYVDESDDIEAKRSASELGRSAAETISAFFKLRAA